MTTLAPLTLGDGTVIYIESTGDIDDLPEVDDEDSPRGGRVSKGAVEQLTKSFEAMQDTMRSYTTYTLDAFRQVAGANIDKVKLEFGVKVAGEAGVPYVTKGTADANIKITVECSFPEAKG
ncbi:MAG: CU044_2847 family protein [Elainellaceae cyanobacterium]